MWELLSENEAIPALYPAFPGEIASLESEINADAVWQRIESYIAYRWTPREVVWIVPGVCEWAPRLGPATVTATEIWNDQTYTWDSVSLNAGPLGGYELTAKGPYKITATVGSGIPPEAVFEAFVRLATYIHETDSRNGNAEQDKRGVRSYSQSIGEISETLTVTPAWLARSMQLSGAADLLRPYRSYP